MIKRYNGSFLPALFLLFAFPAISLAYSDGIAVKVNSEIITFSEFYEQAKKEYIQNGISPEDKEKTKKINTKVINILIDGILVKDQAGEKEIVVEEQEVTKHIENLKKKNNINDQVFEAMVQNQGLTIDEYYDQIRDQILSSRVISAEVNSKIIINEEDIKVYYDKNKNEFLSEPEIEVEHILLGLKRDAPSYEVTSVLERIGDIRASIINGASFEKMAALHSQDPSKGETGSIGFIKRGLTVPPFENAAFALKVGEISKPVRTPFGYHLIKVLNEKPRFQLSYEEAKPQVKDILFRKSFQKHYAEWMKDVRGSAFLEYSDELVKQIDPIAGERTFHAVGAYKYPISKRERARIGKRNYVSVEKKREESKEVAVKQPNIGLKPKLQEKVTFYKYLFDKGLISKEEYMEKLNSLALN